VAGAQPEFILAATHGQLVANACEKLGDPAVREILVTDSVDVHEENRPEQRTVSIAPLLASALERLAAHGPRGELQSKSLRRTAAQAREEI
jgi:ribose-phosphate pyrophosphokinase